jgi:hypothetical protein
MFYERQPTMYMHYRRPRKKLSAEMIIISIFMLISALLSAWLPYFFAQMTLHSLGG